MNPKKTESVEISKQLVYAVCDCGGYMEHVPGSGVLLTNPTQHEHMCDECGKVEYYFGVYPKESERII